MSRLFCGFDSLRHDQGGIARVGRLFALACSRLGSPVNTNDVRIATYLDDQSETVAGISSTPMHKRQWQFAAHVCRQKFVCTHFLYSFLGLARSHSLCPWPRRPFAVIGNGVEIWPGPQLRPKYVETAKRAERIWVISNHTLRQACEVDPTFERAKILWLATEQDELPDTMRRDDTPRVTIIARIDEGYKGHRELIECWPQVVSAVPGATLSIVGRGPRMSEYQTLAGQSSVAGQIEFLGFVPEADMPALWQKTTVFAMPSRGEGFGLVYIEAMRYGVPVIASVHDSGNEVNADGQTGFNVNMDRPAELPDRIIQLLRDRDLNGRMGLAGQARWKEHFRLSAFCDRLRPLMTEFLNT